MTAPQSIIGKEDGNAVVELGLILVPFAIVLLGSFDLGYQLYVKSVMQGTLTEAARKASVENAQVSGSGATLEERIDAKVRQKVDSIARSATYNLKLKNYYEFSGVGKPEKLTTDINGNGEFDEDDGDCWEDLNNNGSYDLESGRSGIGGANDVVFYELNVVMPRLLPMASLVGVSPNYDFTVKTVFKSQPFNVQSIPNIECGVPVP